MKPLDRSEPLTPFIPVSGTPPAAEVPLIRAPLKYVILKADTRYKFHGIIVSVGHEAVMPSPDPILAPCGPPVFPLGYRAVISSSIAMHSFWVNGELYLSVEAKHIVAVMPPGLDVTTSAPKDEEERIKADSKRVQVARDRLHNEAQRVQDLLASVQLSVADPSADPKT